MLSFADGIFDEFIESFHDQFGFDTDHRELLVQDDLTVLSRLGERRLAVLEPPDDGIGDPVFGARYSLFGDPRKWNLIAEAAIKVAFRDHDFFHSSGRSDYGVQLSLQRFFRKQALYLTRVRGVLQRLRPERRSIRRRSSATGSRRSSSATSASSSARSTASSSSTRSPSTVQGTELEELTAQKYLLSGGLQWYRRGWVYRLAVTENLRNFENTPDVGATLSVARVVLGKGSG